MKKIMISFILIANALLLAKTADIADIESQIKDLERIEAEQKKAEAIETQKDDAVDKQTEEKPKNVIYYYLPPEVKVTPEERARVIGKARQRINEREAEKKMAKGKYDPEKEKAKKEAELKAKMAAQKKKDEEEFKKNMAQYEKEQKIRAVENTLGIKHEDAIIDEYEGQSEEMIKILKKNKELDSRYKKAVIGEK